MASYQQQENSVSTSLPAIDDGDPNQDYAAVSETREGVEANKSESPLFGKRRLLIVGGVIAVLIIAVVLAVVLTLTSVLDAAAGECDPPHDCFNDGPFLPNTPEWRVHDCCRPLRATVRPVLDPLPTDDAPTPVPSSAVVLFDGSNLDGWRHFDSDAPVRWTLTPEKSAMFVAPRTGDIQTAVSLPRSYRLHVEWSTPRRSDGASGQARSNSGVFLALFYEIQVLECWENPTYTDGSAGSLYGQWPPEVIPCVEPEQWHVYDIDWRGPVFDGQGNVVSPAMLNLTWNGVVVQRNVEAIGRTTYRDVGRYEAHEEEMPLRLQDHSDPVWLRNIWYQPLD